jgi:hypothetical protein
MMTMFNALTISGRIHKNHEPSMADEISIMLEMPRMYDGTTVTSNTVVTALFWQQYGLDLLHPEVSQWLEKCAPDVKYAVAKKQQDDDEDTTYFRVGRNGTLKVHLSPEVYERLRKVSSDYLWWQVEQSIETTEQKDYDTEKIEYVTAALKNAVSRTFTPSVIG